MSDLKVLPVPRGSIIWLDDIDFAPDDEGEDLDRQIRMLHDRIEEVCGHHEFMLLWTSGGGSVKVVGLDRLVEMVRERLRADEDSQAAAFVADVERATSMPIYPEDLPDA